MPVQPPCPHPGAGQPLTLPSRHFIDAIPFTDFKTVSFASYWSYFLKGTNLYSPLLQMFN